ncbi:MAG: hypothetical protein JXD23_01095 [Spirochaetales bacterium]|nr:hypothetical protein [Spirochaetales bacterium]
MKGAHLPKRVLIVIITFLLVGASAQAFDFGAGLSLSYGLSLINDYIPGMTTFNGSINHLEAGAYFDAMFARLTFMYVTNIGNPHSSPPFTGRLWTAQIGGSLLLKFPVVIKSLTLWSGAGAGFLTTIMMDLDGDGVSNLDPAANLNDIYLVIAFGGEFKIANLMKIGPVFTLNYNLTPSTYDTEPAGSTHTQVMLQFSVAAGFAF